MRIQRSLQTIGLAAVCSLMLSLAGSFAGVGSVLAQSIDWEETHGTSTGGSAVARLDDGGFIAIGAGGEYPSFTGYIVRTDANGEKVWDKRLGDGSTSTWLTGVKKTADGGFILVGELGSAPSIWKLKSNGDLDWTRRLMGPMSYGSARAVVAVSDGYIVTGMNFYAADYKMFVQKMNLTGDSVWSDHLITYQGSRGSGIRQTLDGGFLVVGQAKTTGYRTYAVKVTPTGGIAWEKIYAGVDNGYDEGHDIAIHTDGYLIVGNKTRSANEADADVIRIGLDGEQVWRKQLTTSGYSGANGVRQMSDGYMVAGYAGASTQSYNGHIWKLNLTGAVVGEKQLAAASYLHFIDQAIPPLKFVVVGATSTSKLYLARVDAAGAVTPPDPKTFIYTYDGAPSIEFHSTSGWEGAGPGKIKMTIGNYDTLTINGLLKIRMSSFTIDTTRADAKGSMSYVGTGYLLSPHTRVINKPVLAEGIWNGKIDDDGVHFEVPMRSERDKGLFGSYMAVRNIDVGNYPQASVAKLDGDFRMSGWKSCSGNEDIKFSGLEMTPTSMTIKRIGDIQVEPGVCYQNLTSTYASSKDSLYLNGDFISYMFFRSGVKASTSIVQGNISDLVLEATKPEVPIGSESNYKVRNLTGKYSKWYFRLLNSLIPLGSGALINGVLTHPSGVFEVDLVSAFLSAPGDLKGWGGPMNYRMYKNADAWHIAGNGDVKIKWGPDYTTFSVKGDVFAGELFPGAYAFIGKGDLFANSVGGRSNFTNGKATGIIYKEVFTVLSVLPLDLGPLSSIIRVMISTINEDQPADLRLLNNRASLYFKSPGLEEMGFDIDLMKKTTDVGFLTFHSVGSSSLGSFMVKTRQKDKKTAAETTNEFSVANNTRSIWVKVAGQSAPVTTSLKSPAGTVINAASSDLTVRRVEVSANEYWWILDNPEAGDWSVAANGSGSDTIAIYAILAPAPLEITASQQGREVTVNWTNKTDAVVFVYLDNDQQGFDGINVATAAGQSGTTTITLTDNLPECTYYVYAERQDPIEFQSSYAATSIDNAKSILLAPRNMEVSYDEAQKSVTLSWDSTLDGSTAGFIVRLFGNGQDTVIAMPFGNEKMATFLVEDPSGMFVTMMSYDTNGTRGCWSANLPIVTSDVAPGYHAARGIEAVVLPNPARVNATLHFTLEEQSIVNIMLVNSAGHLLKRFESQTYSEGPHDLDLATDGMASGSYIVLIEAGDKRQTRNFVITR